MPRDLKTMIVLTVLYLGIGGAVALFNDGQGFAHWMFHSQQGRDMTETESFYYYQIRDALGPMALYTDANLGKLREVYISSWDPPGQIATGPLTRCVHAKQVMMEVSSFGLISADLQVFNDLREVEYLNCTVTFMCASGLERWVGADGPPLDLAPLGGLSQLRELILKGRCLQSLRPLGTCGNLEKLDCSYTNASDLTPLARLPRLRTLDISCTKVTDLTPLLSMASLKEVTARRLPIDPAGQTVIATLGKRGVTVETDSM